MLSSSSLRHNDVQHSNLLPPAFISNPLPSSRSSCTPTICPVRAQQDVDLNSPSNFSNLSSTLTSILNPLPPPVVLARPTLDRDFAVLLMRAGYNAVDALDFVSMEEFQKQFFRIRSLQWEQYIKKNIGIRQGILTDPRYFDFISYAQMLTIQYLMRTPQAVFEERYQNGEGWETRVVQRDVERLPEGADILREWRREVGIRIREAVGPKVQGGDFLEVVQGVYSYFERNGFQLKTKVEHGEGKVRVEMVVPAFLWGNRALRRRRGITNDYDCFCVQAFAESMGESNVQCETFASENSIVRTWKL